MKKNKIIVLLVLFVMMPLFVKADMAAPEFTYKVRISNPDGAEIYEWIEEGDKYKYKKTGKKLNYDEIYDVIYEHIFNNELYGDVVKKEIDADGTVTYNDIETIKLEDVKPLEVNIKDYKLEEKIKYYVFDDSCYLYNGPSKLYGKVSPEISLNIGTIIETEYADEMWAYIEYKGVKGWVYTYSYSFNTSEETAGMVTIYDDYDQSIKTVKDVIMYSSPKNDKKLGVTIPKEVELKVIYEYSSIPHLPHYYVEYNGTRGWIKTIEEDYLITNIAYKCDDTFDDLVVNDKNGITFYSEANNLNTSIGKIPYQTKLKPLYYIIDGHFEVWYLIEYNGQKGWVDISLFYDDDIIEENPSDIIDDDIIEENPSDIIDDEDKSDISPEKSINEKIICYTCGTIILSLTAVVTIILINKKKKEKNVNK